MVSISITVLKALKESEDAGQRKFPAASVKISNQAKSKIINHNHMKHLTNRLKKNIKRYWILHSTEENVCNSVKILQQCAEGCTDVQIAGIDRRSIRKFDDNTSLQMLENEERDQLHHSCIKDSPEEKKSHTVNKNI